MGSKPVVSLPSARALPCNQRGRRAISVSPVAIIMRSVAMIVGATRQIPCNDSGLKLPMIAIPDPDDCGSLQITARFVKIEKISMSGAFESFEAATKLQYLVLR